MASDLRLEGKVALVTGAASGIGLACCERFKREGASVIGLDINAAETAACELFRQLDVTDLAAQQALVTDAVTQFGRIDIFSSWPQMMPPLSLARRWPWTAATPRDIPTAWWS